MPGVGFETWFPKSCPTVFKVQNIAFDKKTIHIFQYPIFFGKIRDLLAIPVVSEADIRHSLLKGELNIKIRSGEAKVVESNIDLLQFDACHRQFLIDAGITNGIDAPPSPVTLPFAFKQNVELIGVKNGINRIFVVPGIDKFIQGVFGNNIFKILIRHNGRGLVEFDDYTVSESGGSGTGFDTITLTFSPPARSELFADYVVEV